MQRMNGVAWAVLATCALLAAGCEDDSRDTQGGAGMGAAATGAGGMAGAPAAMPTAAATINPFGMGNAVTGTATFVQSGTNVTVTVMLMNCPDGAHGVHIHQGTSCDSADTQGAHWDMTRGEGIPNVMCANGTGSASVTRSAMDPTTMWTVGGDAATNVIGHAFVVHNPPPNMTDPAPRIGCGVIAAK